MGTNNVKILSVDNPHDAPNYRELGGYKTAIVTRFVVVGRGTVEGNPTVDIELVDEDGNKYVAMISGRLLEAVAAGAQHKRMIDNEEN